MSLVEQLVAATLLLLAMILALGQLDLARDSFEVGEGRAELQMGLRVAIDRMARELGQTGLNVDPGSTEEAIEFAGATAIVFRADLDWQTSDADRPERELSAVPGSVTTGNDEIVGYLLARPETSGREALRFEADVVGVPRDGRVESIAIPRVDLDQGHPPYTLYRVHLRPDSVSTTRVPLIDRVRSLRLEYFDRDGREVLPAGGGAEGRRARESIDRIRFRIERQSLRADPRWVDPGDPSPATRHHRKLAIGMELSPRNLHPPYAADRRPVVSENRP